MEDMRRILDKYAGEDICKMSTEDRDDFFTAVARRGAIAALVSVGLDDDKAINDLKDLRSLIVGYRVAKSTVWSQMWKIGITVVTLWLIALLFPHDKATAIINLIKN